MYNLRNGKTVGRVLTVKASSTRTWGWFLTIKASSTRTPGGFLTIEASLLIPFILSIYLFLLFTAFHLYNSCLLEQDLYLISLRGSTFTAWDEGYGEVLYGAIPMREEEEIVDYMENRSAWMDAAGRLPTFVTEDINIEIIPITYNSGTAELSEGILKTSQPESREMGVEFEVRITISGRNGHFPEGEREMTVQSQAAVPNPIAIIRGVRREIINAGD